MFKALSYTRNTLALTKTNLSLSIQKKGERGKGGVTKVTATAGDIQGPLVCQRGSRRTSSKFLDGGVI